MKNHNQFYTEIRVAQRLAGYLKSAGYSPSLCLELCAGKGGLISPIASIWKDVEFVTCDIDVENINQLKDYFPDSKHDLLDVTDPEFELFIQNLNGKNVDLAVCNPPFSWMESNDYIESVVSSVFGNIFRGYKRLRQEVIFIAQNLRALSSSGYLCLILPELLVYGQSFKKFRQILSAISNIECVMEVASKSFKGTEAKTYILVVRKQAEKSESFKYFRDNGIYVKKSIADFVLGRADGPLKTTDIFSVMRGKHAGNDVKKSSLPYFHTTSFKDFPNGVVSVSEHSQFPTFSTILESMSSAVMAMPGDILIARVGSRIVGKSAIVESGFFLVSDCIYVVRFSDPSIGRNLIRYNKDGFEQAMRSLARGTCARYLTMSDVDSQLEKLLKHNELALDNKLML